MVQWGLSNAGGVGVIMLAGCCWVLLVLGPDAQTVKNTMQDTQCYMVLHTLCSSTL